MKKSHSKKQHGSTSPGRVCTPEVGVDSHHHLAQVAVGHVTNVLATCAQHLSQRSNLHNDYNKDNISTPKFTSPQMLHRPQEYVHFFAADTHVAREQYALPAFR